MSKVPDQKAYLESGQNPELTKRYQQIMGEQTTSARLDPGLSAELGPGASRLRPGG
jgi:hypothetical protein